MVNPLLSVKNLMSGYGDIQILWGIDFEIGAGEVFGLLGPNGAGKTTTIEILEGYRKRDGGEVEVLGVDPQATNRAWRERIGVVLQSSSLYPNLTVRQAAYDAGRGQLAITICPGQDASPVGLWPSRWCLQPRQSPARPGCGAVRRWRWSRRPVVRPASGHS